MSNHRAVGYVLKQAQSLLRLRMEEALRPLDLTVSQYSCLFQLSREPGISAAALARGTFVTRQSMNTMLQLLLDRGLVDRPDRAENGRALPTELTPAGAATLESAQDLVDAVESRMLSALTPGEQSALAASLAKCASALS
jgi:DNA-binding MarR family transcriptional regulator